MAGGFAVKRLGCVHVVARERGKRRIHRATLSSGMRDAPRLTCAAPPAPLGSPDAEPASRWVAAVAGTIGLAYVVHALAVHQQYN